MSKKAKNNAPTGGDESVKKQSLGAKGKRKLSAMLEEYSTEHAVLRGRNGASVYGCRRILLYSPEEIRLQLHREFVSVRGEGLFCSSFAAGTVEVKGEIDGVFFLGRDEIFPSADGVKKPKKGDAK